MKEMKVMAKYPGADGLPVRTRRPSFAINQRLTLRQIKRQALEHQIFDGENKSQPASAKLAQRRLHQGVRILGDGPAAPGQEQPAVGRFPPKRSTLKGATRVMPRMTASRAIEPCH